MLARSAFKSRLTRTRTEKRPAEKHCPQFLQWLRGRECAAAHIGGCEGKMTAAHVDHAGGKGMATKVGDQHALPLCEKHARLQHNIGWESFEVMVWKRVGAAVEIARQYFQAWPGRIAWLKKLAGAE